MALRSMTGFGRGNASRGGVKLDVEIASVNRKQFSVRATLPRQLAALEPRVDAVVHESIARGCVTVNVQLHIGGAARLNSVVLDQDVAAGLLQQLRTAARKLNIEDKMSISDLIRLPDVFRQNNALEDVDALWPLLKRALVAALKELDVMRKTEGKALREDIECRIDFLLTQHADLCRLAPRVPRGYAGMLQRRIEAMGVPLASDDPALLREIALFADRSDITEELTRIGSHLAQFRQLLKSAGVCGRSLDFICQELFREVNTTGSKANDADISAVTIAFKSEVERIREQVQNIE